MHAANIYKKKMLRGFLCASCIDLYIMQIVHSVFSKKCEKVCETSHMRREIILYLPSHEYQIATQFRVD